jgi:hypothetical protein
MGRSPAGSPSRRPAAAVRVGILCKHVRSAPRVPAGTIRQ